jgi:hypothetical protein
MGCAARFAERGRGYHRQHQPLIDKSFLLLFFKKEALP